MRLSTRNLLNHAFSWTGVFAIALMAGVLAVILIPIFWRGAGAYVFRATVEYRKQERELFQRGNAEVLERETGRSEEARQPIYDKLRAFRNRQEEAVGEAIEISEGLGQGEDARARRVRAAVARLRAMEDLERQVTLMARMENVLRDREENGATAELDRLAAILSQLEHDAQLYGDLVRLLRDLLGPLPGDERRILPRERFGQTRWDRTQVKLHRLLHVESWDHSNPDAMGQARFEPRKDLYQGTPLYGVFDYVATHIEAIMRPRWTFYWRFLTDVNHDSNLFGGIGPAALGTLYLTLLAVLFAVPFGLGAAIYFTEYARPGKVVSLLRTCVSTLAGVPSIVFGLFGLAFFIHTIRVSPSKSVLAGSLTLGLLILPTVIRASEEAILAVPRAYKEAAMSLGAGRWRTVMTVVLPAALPGILTGIVISMGRAAGETAPIIFTAAVSVGLGLRPWEVFDQPTPALSWNIYNLATEHEAVDEIRHVQYGMVTTLVGIVLLLNGFAIALRAAISKKLRG